MKAKELLKHLFKPEFDWEYAAVQYGPKGSILQWWKLLNAPKVAWLRLESDAVGHNFSAMLYFTSDFYRDLKDQSGSDTWQADTLVCAEAQAKEMAAKELMDVFYGGAKL